MRHLNYRSYCSTVAVFIYALLGQHCLEAQSFIPKEVPTGYFYMSLPIPQQTLMCDIAGIGRVTGSTVDRVIIEPVHFWLGIAATNRVEIWYNMGRIGNLPVTNSTVMFFATTNLWWTLHGSTNFPSSRSLYSFDFITTPPAVYNCTTTNWTTINDLTSVVPFSEMENGICVFASNLVHAAHFSKNAELFYSLVKHGATNTQTKVAQDSQDFVFFRRNYLPTNLVSYVDGIIEQQWRSRID